MKAFKCDHCQKLFEGEPFNFTALDDNGDYFGGIIAYKRDDLCKDCFILKFNGLESNGLVMKIERKENTDEK